jgi:hypothetical protein
MKAQRSPRIPEIAAEAEIDALVADALALRPLFRRVDGVLRVTFAIELAGRDSERISAPR